MYFLLNLDLFFKFFFSILRIFHYSVANTVPIKLRKKQKMDGVLGIRT